MFYSRMTWHSVYALARTEQDKMMGKTAVYAAPYQERIYMVDMDNTDYQANSLRLEKTESVGYTQTQEIQRGWLVSPNTEHFFEVIDVEHMQYGSVLYLRRIDRPRRIEE